MRTFTTRLNRLPLILTVVFVAVVFAAIAQTKQSSRTVQIGEFHAQVHVSLHVGDTLRVVLPSTPSTGYSWHAAGGTSLLKSIGSTNVSAAKSSVGAPARQTLAFMAEAPGASDLVLDYSRPWEKGKPAARQYMLQVTVDDGTNSTASPVVIDGSAPVGTYSGKLPCADCSGLLTSIALYASGSAQSPVGYYVRTSTYLGAPKGNVIFIEAGNYLLQRGTPANPDWTVYTLQSNTSDHLENYRLEGDALVPLDSDDKPIQSPFNMRLKLQS
jgi:copper homeostasis protein (lipoprotein)